MQLPWRHGLQMSFFFNSRAGTTSASWLMHWHQHQSEPLASTTTHPTSPPSCSRHDGKLKFRKPQERKNVQPYFRRQRIQQHSNFVFLRFVVLRSDARAKKQDEANKMECLHVCCTKTGAIKLDEEKWGRGVLDCGFYRPQHFLADFAVVAETKRSF